MASGMCKANGRQTSKTRNANKNGRLERKKAATRKNKLRRLERHLASKKGVNDLCAKVAYKKLK